MFVYAFVCDVCGATETANPRAGYWSYQLPKGWRSIDGRQVCTLACIARYAADPEAFPAQEKDPDPIAEAFNKALGDKTASATA